MQPMNNSPWLIRFGVFEVNVKTGELRKQGARIKLQEQPFQVLAMLLEKPGEIVTREEMQQRLWSKDTFVDFDHSLNKAINKIRDALCDSADNPRFIETLARRGYRFVAPVEWNHLVPRPPNLTETTAPLQSEESTQFTPSNSAPHEGTAQLPIHPEVRGGPDAAKEESNSGLSTAYPAPVGRILPRWNAKRWIGVAALLAISIIPLYWYLSRQKTEVSREPLRIVPFTTLPGREEAPKFSPDGKFVAFDWNGPSRDNWDIYVKQVGQEGQLLRLTSDPAWDFCPAWSPDGGEIAFVRASGDVTSIFTVPSLGGVERKLYELRAPSGLCVLSWSPDGRWLAFAEKSAVESPYGIFLLSLDTRQKIPLTSPPPGPYGDFSQEFSPDGKRVAFVRQRGFFVYDLWVQPISSGEATQLTYETYGGIARPAWTTDGREVIFAAFVGSSWNLFRIPLTGGVPQAVAGIGENASHPSIWKDHLVFTQRTNRVDKIWRMRGPNYKGNNLSTAPILVSTRSEFNPDYSPDGKKLAFMSERSGFNEIWTSDCDGANPVMLTSRRTFSGTPRWSPDGKRIAFDGRAEGNLEIYAIDVDGGIPRRLTNEKSQDQTPSWSRDGRWIYFSSNRSGNFQVWKIPSEGGKAIQVTKGGGFYARESFDGKMLYYNKPGRQGYAVGQIWKVPRDGSEEILVLDREVAFADWVLRPEGIYLSTSNARKHTIEFLSFQTEKVTLIYQEETPNARDFLAISPDGQWFLYNDEPPRESDLMLVENFR